ncbi:spore coat putative kinase YutH [Bacillus solitudinis]|uniref:spore coat putative kinase YutH n=1 Tax=Bacillus solitudinis TaxID=2014074 RepID=UPI000C24D2DA|nr:spore coat protein YutH [Bacillus solitudinis]
MFERNVYDSYQLYCDSRFSIGDYEAFEANGQSYIILPKEECASNELEMIAYIDYMRSIGDTSILELQQTVQKGYVGLVDGQDVYVCKLTAESSRQGFRLQSDFQRGEHLAAIHYYGKQMPTKQKNFDYFGQWHRLWEKRLEQLEGWYQQVLYEGPQSIVDEAFLFSYPYFMGLTENAIQYAVDANLDDKSKEQEQGTISHRRFTEKTWLILSEYGDFVKRPTDFVYDHRCRDIAEWIRSKRDQLLDEGWSGITDFLEGYEQYEPLSSFAWRMTYARLLFPLHYFETIESYYRSQLPDEKNVYGQAFFQLLEKEQLNQQFLEQFLNQIQLQRTVGMTQKVDWL